MQAHQTAALDEVKTEHAAYFKALEAHPRTLVGQEVPAIGKEGMETLRDADDAKDWQDAVKHLLVGEIKARATKAMDEQSDFLTTVHASIDLFKNNADLVPGTKDFDVELANRFTSLAEPYELRVEGKLQGYSLPVQPLIDKLRTQIAAERAAAPSSAATPPAGAAAPSTTAAPATPPAPADQPQAGITSKAGSGASDGDDFSTLWSTIDPALANLRI